VKQLHKAAPTLPIHSPHSPVHPYSYPNVQLNKLSGRYIYNKKAPQKSTNKLLNTKQLAININDFREKERLAPNYSTMTCSCPKSPNFDDTITPKERNCFDFSHSSSTNIMVKEPTFNVSKSPNRNSNHNDHLLPIPQSSFENFSTSDLNLKKIAKQSRFSQQIRFDKANMAFYDNPQRLSRFAAQDNQNKCHYALTISKSEQTSPNNIDIKKTTFTYDNNKRIASSLLYVSSMDPWTKKSEIQMDGYNEIDETSGNPWIKRTVGSHTPTSRFKEKSQNGHLKPFPSARRDLFLETKKSNYLQPEVQRHQSIRNGECIASAPPSPHFLKTTNEACSLNRLPNEGMQTKSASFSPARGRNLLNPFGDIDICEDNVTRNSFQANYVSESDQPRRTEHSSNNLDVNNPKKLQNRHSFSTISEQSKDELQLNVRRLSEQMSQMSLKKIIKFSLSDCNVNNKGSNDQETLTVKGSHYTGNTDCKKISKSKDGFSSLQQSLNPNVSTVLGNTKIYAKCQKSNSMQETTC